MNESNHQYNADDFARYHSGSMSAREMHALEKTALDDPFLADALDGYAYSNDATKELEEIKTRLNEKKNAKKIFSFFNLAENGWWKVAAMFIIIAGTAYFIFNNSSSTKNTSMAQREIATAKDSSELVSRAKADTVKTEVVLENAQANKKETTSGNALLSPEKPAASSSDIASHKEAINNTEEKKAAKNLPSKKVISSYLAKEKEVALADASRNNSLSAPVKSDTDAAVAFAAPKIVIRGTRDTNQEKDSSLAEVVVVGYDVKNKKAQSQELEGKVAGVSVNQNKSDIAYLLEGKENFDNYIKQNAIPVFSADSTKLSANILLSFVLNENRKPSKIKVLSSNCKPCEEEAIRLLKQGPDWVGEPGAKGTIRIEF